MEKKYRLLKPTWDKKFKVGDTVAVLNNEGGYNITLKTSGVIIFYNCPKDEIETNPEWWELVVENKVSKFGFLWKDDGYMYKIYTTHPISPEKFPHIMSLIEKELNS